MTDEPEKSQEPENSQEIIPSPIKIDKVDLLQTGTSKVRDLFSAVIKLNNTGVFHEPTCSLCANKYRFEIEEFFLKIPQYETDKFAKTKAFIESKGENITIDVIKNHCGHHIDQGASQLRKIEYIETLDNLSSVKMSTLEECDLMVAALKERMLEISKLAPDHRTSRVEIEEIKSNVVNQISKSISNLLVLRAKLLGEMKENGEVIIIQRNKFKIAFNNALNRVKTDEERNIVVDLLKDLSKAEDKSSS